MKKIFRIIAFLEGVSYILLLFIAVPIKYNLEDSTYVKLLGMPHGILFIVYIVIAFVIQFEKHGSLIEFKNNIKNYWWKSKRLKVIGVYMLFTTIYFVLVIFLVEERVVGLAIYILFGVLQPLIWNRYIVDSEHLLTKRKLRWTNNVFLIILIASLLPFGTFYIDWKYLSN